MSPAKSHKRDAISGSVFPREIFAANVRAQRARLSLSQNDVAERMSALQHVWSRPTVSQVERAARPVSVDELYGLALTFGVDVLSLLAPAHGDSRLLDVGLVHPIPAVSGGMVLGKGPGRARGADCAGGRGRMSDRIDLDPDGTPDDVYIAPVTAVHIERMSDDHVWMRIDRPDGSAVVCRFYGGSNGWLRGGAKVWWSLEED